MADANDQIRGTELALFVRRSRGNQSGDLRILVIDLKHCANTLKGQTHIDVKVFCASRRKIVCVRVVLLSEGVRINLKHILGVVLVKSVELIFVALRQRFGDLVHRFIRQYEAQSLIFEALAPAVIQFSRIRSPGHDRVIDDQVLVDLVIELLQGCRQRLHNLLEPLAQLGVIPIEYRESRIQIAPSADIV